MNRKKIIWRENRREEIICDYQTRLSDREHELQAFVDHVKNQGVQDLKLRIQKFREEAIEELRAKLQAMQQRGMESLKQKVANRRRKHSELLARMEENHLRQIEKLGLPHTRTHASEAGESDDSSSEDQSLWV
jgi:hypothetical protein